MGCMAGGRAGPRAWGVGLGQAAAAAKRHEACCALAPFAASVLCCTWDCHVGLLPGPSPPIQPSPTLRIAPNHLTSPHLTLPAPLSPIPGPGPRRLAPPCPPPPCRHCSCASLRPPWTLPLASPTSTAATSSTETSPHPTSSSRPAGSALPGTHRPRIPSCTHWLRPRRQRPRRQRQGNRPEAAAGTAGAAASTSSGGGARSCLELGLTLFGQLGSSQR